LNDGLYGNDNSWLGNELGPTSGKVYAGVYFTERAKEISGIALGRDNLGGFVDRAAGNYLVEFTLDEFNAADDAAIDAASWTTIGIATAHLTGGVRTCGTATASTRWSSAPCGCGPSYITPSTSSSFWGSRRRMSSPTPS